MTIPNNGKAAVAIIGLGTMGSRIAARMLANGHTVTVFNRTASRAAPLVNAGAKLATSAALAVHNADIVFTCLRGDEIELDATLGQAGGFLSTMRTGALHVSLSTLGPSVAVKLSQAHLKNGTRYLVCQMQGRAQAAEAGKLLLWSSGAKADLESVEPVLATFASQICHLGAGIELAPVVKLAVNMLMFANVELFAETSAYLARCGAQPAQVFGILTETLFSTPLFKGIAASFNGDHASDGTNISTSLLDLQMLLEHAQRVGASMPAAAAVTSQFDSAAKGGYAHLAQSAVILPLSLR